MIDHTHQVDKRKEKVMPGLAGTSLGRYYLKERLGWGGMSEVYLAWDEQMQREVALKIVSSTHVDYIERFHREAEAISNLHHAHILPALDYGEQEPWHYLVMPYIEHGTLRDRLVNGPLTLEETGALLEQIAEALQFAHDQGIIHRDIKPSNILMRDDHYVYLADFGLAKTLEGGSTITQTGNLLGTPEYMAPELAEGPATTSSDLYALGILLYQMVTGQLPFSGETPIAVYWKQLQDLPRRPSYVNPAVPPAIEQVIMKALDKKPPRRYQSAKELAEAYIHALTFPNELVKENVTPPSFYSTTSMNGGSAPASAGSGAHVPAQREKLVLPNDPLVTPSAVPQRRRRLMRRRGSRAAPLPPYPAEPVVPAVARQRVHASLPKVQLPSRRRRILYRRRNRVLISLMVVLVMLLLVAVVILTLAYIYK
jgi:serine/threonine protein kinase